MAKKNDATTLARPYFTFYRSFMEAIDECPNENQLNIYRAIANYALNGVEPELTGLELAIFKLAKPVLDKGAQGYINGCKGASHGVKGGNPNFAKGKPNPYYKHNPQDNPEHNHQDNPEHNHHIEKEKDIENDNILSSDKSSDNNPPNPLKGEISPSEEKKVKSERKRFVKPTLEEVRAYIFDKGYNVDAEQFHAYYESQGWLVGKNPMKNWKAAVVTWSKKQYHQAPQGGYLTNSDQARQQRAQGAAAIMARLLAEDEQEVTSSPNYYSKL